MNKMPLEFKEGVKLDYGQTFQLFAGEIKGDKSV